MNIIILGDKFQKRTKSKGCMALRSIKNKKILDIQYTYIKKNFPNSKIIYVYGFDKKRFCSYINAKKYNSSLQLVYNPKYEQYNYTYNLCLVSNCLDQDTMILFGDTILENKTFKNFDCKKGSQIFLSKTKKDIGCIVTDKKINFISYNLSNYLQNIYYLNKRDSLILQQILQQKPNKYNNAFVFEIINLMIEKKCEFKPILI